jgi:phospholipid/cholesterol/gamma-HCH transport system ATP-binding protein
VEAPVIQFKNVKKAFGEKVILDGINFQIDKGKTLAVIGPSGIGKSTVLKLMIGLLAPDSGEIIIKGENVVDYTEDQWNNLRRDMGMVFQYSALFDFLDVGENVAFGLRQHTKMSEEEIKKRVTELLGMVGLPGTEEAYPAELSGGMKKRVGLARALALNPDIVFYDEPTAGLDPIMANNISRLILQTKKKLGVTSVLVTHDMTSAFLAADDVLLLNKGQIAFMGTVEETKATTNPMVREFIRGEDVIIGNMGKEDNNAEKHT